MKLLLAAALLLSPFALAAQEHEPGGMPEMRAQMPAKPPVLPSHALTLINGAQTRTLTIADLAKLPQITVHVHNAHRNADEAYTGPCLRCPHPRRPRATHENESTILRSYIVALATDHYSVVYSAAEMEPGFSNSKVIVAIGKAGGAITEGGDIQLINTDGAKPAARWIHGLTTPTVTTVPPTK